MAGPNDAINFQVVIPVIAAVVGLFGGWFAKIRELRYQDRKSEAATWTIQQQTHWGPLLKSARELKERLEDLTTIYNDDQKKGEAASLSADFRELYLMRREEVQNFQNCDPDAARKTRTMYKPYDLECVTSSHLPRVLFTSRQLTLAIQSMFGEI
jgi:hypothetical protein